MYGTDSGSSSDEPADRQTEPSEREIGLPADGSSSATAETPGTVTDDGAAPDEGGAEAPDEPVDPGGSTEEEPDTGTRKPDREPLNPLERLKRSYRRHPKRTAIRVLVGQALLLVGGAILAGNDPHTIVRGLGVLILTNPEIVGAIIALLGTALLGSDYKDEVQAISSAVVAMLQSKNRQRETDGEESDTEANTDTDTRGEQ